jgi:hypothetical protein
MPARTGGVAVAAISKERSVMRNMGGSLPASLPRWHISCVRGWNYWATRIARNGDAISQGILEDGSVDHDRPTIANCRILAPRRGSLHVFSTVPRPLAWAIVQAHLWCC